MTPRGGFAARRLAALLTLGAVLLLPAAGKTAQPDPATGGAAQLGREPPAVDAEAWLVVDAASGTVIAAEDAGERRQIASATKLMTALLTLERARPGRVLTAADYDAAPIESQIGLRDGERMAVRDLLVALLLESANDAAVTLAEGVEGTTAAFVAEMNERAGELGLDGTSYANPIGFDHPENYSTAADLAALAGVLMERRRFREVVAAPRLELSSGAVPRVVENRNDLIGEAPSVDGVKTGHTLGAGHVLVGSAAGGGERVISVVLGAPDEATRDGATLELLRYGLEQFRERRVISAGEPLAEALVAGRDDERVELSAADGLALTVLRGDSVETRLDAPREVEGPLAAGEQVGSATVIHRGERAGRVALVTARPVAGPGALSRVATTLGDHWAAAAALALLVCGAVALVAVRVRGSSERQGSGSIT